MDWTRQRIQGHAVGSWTLNWISIDCGAALQVARSTYATFNLYVQNESE